MPSLPSPLRKQLETAIKTARTTAEAGARKALEALAVHEADPYRHMDPAQRTLRRKLSAQGQQLGDAESHSRPGTYDIHHLAEKVAYDQWHRLLFARYLLENGLLISPEHEVAVTLTDCEELAPSLGLKDAWAVAGRFTAAVLPEAFRADDPAAAVDLPIEERNQLLRLLTSLPTDIFTATDSLGWTYQFWQADKKETVNKSEKKIGADELPSVTQLFTEDYMVDFLLDNTLGAWWAGKKLSADFADFADGRRFESEDDCRKAVALPGCPWKYLRFIQSDSASVSSVSSVVKSRWSPAAGTFDGWPRSAAALRAIDPCMGSGHFIVALFERLVALRMAEQSLDEAAAVTAVIRDNLFGLEIDPRCTQIAAFNLALAAWRRVGHCQLPPMNLACSGLAPNSKEADWLALAGDNQKLQRGMERLYKLFLNAPILGSLINPRVAEGDLLVASFHEVQPLLEKALAQETKDDTAHEMAVTARGLAKAAKILAGQFTLVATNVPFLATRKQDETLIQFLSDNFYNERFDLAAAFVNRSKQFLESLGTAALVSPQSWQFLGSYENLRREILCKQSICLIARLGAEAFETITGQVVNVATSIIQNSKPTLSHSYSAFDISTVSKVAAKAESLSSYKIATVLQARQLDNADAALLMSEQEIKKLLQDRAEALAGSATGDSLRFYRSFWEVAHQRPDWEFMLGSLDKTSVHCGRSQMVLWEEGKGSLYEFVQSMRHLNSAAQRWRTGQEAWNKSGVAVSRMGQIVRTLYTGEIFDQNVAVIVPSESTELSAIWAYCESNDFVDALKRANPSLAISSATVAKVPFDLAHWQKVAAEKYPNGLPKPYSSDPTQWLFNGHPAGSDQPLHVAVARLLRYQWPRQTGSSFPDCPALGPDGLESLADGDGIVCLSATKGEQPAAERLRSLLAAALGTFDLKQLLTTADPKGSKSETLDEWLRDEFFQQHCRLFHHRPFVWHIWDGLKNGFSALVNYHQLTHAHLEKLTFAYLGDWIRRQQAAVEAGESGSDARLQAARELQARLQLILAGDPPYDIFVRWKPLSQQAIGWHPDLNDGVRMNIRPFVEAGVLRKKVKIKWDKDRGKEPQRDKAEYPWFWGWDEEKQDFAGGRDFTGDRWNACHFTNEFKRKARTH